MAVEGRLDQFRLPEILQVISQQRKTGILTIQGEEDIIAVSFLQGRVVAADALNETAMEGVGTILVEQGRLEADALHRLSSRAETEGKRLADLLIGESAVERRDLLEALRIQTQRVLLALLGWEEGDFKFYGGDEVSYEEGFRSIGVDELLLRAIEEDEPARARSVPDLDTRLRRLESDRPVVLRHARTLGGARATPDDGQTVWVTPDEQRVLEAVSEDRTVAEIADAGGVTDERARYVLYRLIREGLVAPLAGAPPAAGRVGPALSGGAPARSGPGASPSPARPAPPARPSPPSRPGAVAAPVAREKPRPRDAERQPAAAVRSIGVGVSLLAAALLATATIVVPVSFFLPFPWQRAERQAMHDRRDAAHLLELDLAAKTFFLLQGRFPDTLDELVDADLLERADLFDSRGRRLSYEPRERSYAVRPLVADAGRPGSVDGFEEGIAGNFLLDPEVVGVTSGASAGDPPLVLLD